jgi:hypothetical protein
VCARTDEERAFASFSSRLWFYYTILSVVRAALGALGVCRTFEDSERVETLDTIEHASWARRAGLILRWMGRQTFLTMVSQSDGAHNNKSVVEMLHFIADGGNPSTYVSLLQGAHGAIVPDSASDEVEDEEERPRLTMTPSMTAAGDNDSSSTDGHRHGLGDTSRVDHVHTHPSSMALHRANVSSVCTQALDVGFALLDLLTQGVVAIGCAALTLPVS